MGLKKEELISLAETRLDDARTLLENDRYDGSIYLSGYVVELALKSKIVAAHNFEFPIDNAEKNGTFPSNGKDISKTKLWTHDLSMLANYAGFDVSVSPEIKVHWSVIQVWNSTIRYCVNSKSKAAAEEMLESVCFLLGKLR